MILLALIALAARANAAPERATVAEAIRYADILTGVDRDDEDDEADPEGEDRDDDELDDDSADDRDDADRGDAPALSAFDRADDDDPVDDDRRAAGLEELADRESDGLGSGGDEDDEASSAARDDGEPGAPASFAGVAMLDADLADPGVMVGDEATVGNAAAGAAETYESWMRHRRPSPWGRLDVGIEWHRRWSDPMHAAPHRYDEVWLFATWRR